MGKRLKTLNGTGFYQMVLTGAANLSENAQRVDALNVFPVPDGDTGTNMNLTMSSGVEELKKNPNGHLGKAAEALSKGLLMGARGNSGVILSQLFRGFAKSVHDLEKADAQQFAAALQQGVEMAYKAVVKPVEGTILTVAREAAKYGAQAARRKVDVAEQMREVLQAGRQALDKTPDLLPVLKQVGVVDAGGQGLICIYEGFVQALSDQSAGAVSPRAEAKPPVQEMDLPNLQEIEQAAHHSKSAQSKLRTEDIEQGYCTEFIVKLVPGKVQGVVFDESLFRTELSGFGDSLLVVADDELVKVHIHAEYPGNVLNHAMKYGDLTKIKIENMREQHSHILAADAYDAQPAENGLVVNVSTIDSSRQPVPYGFVAVAAGEGISEIFTSLGVDAIISGGKTMNPSTEDIVNAVRDVPAETVFVLPNNSNIVLAAQQAKELVEEKNVIVIPSKTIPQGIAAMLAFHEKAGEQNAQSMERALGNVQSGQVTFAVRDTAINGIDIKEGDCIGIRDNKIITANRELLETCRRLLDSMMELGGEVVTILAGEEAKAENTDAIRAYVEDAYPDAEVEVYSGGQPLYAYIFSVE